MRRIYRNAVLLLTVLLIATSCVIGPKSLSPQQQQEFILEKHIQPLAIENVGGVMTVISYKDNKHMGCYIAWMYNGIESHLLTSPLHALQNSLIIEPVSAVYDATLGYDVFCITINDKNMQNKAHTIKLIFSQNKEIFVPIQNQGDMIIYQRTEKYSSKVDIIIYDKDQIELLKMAF